MRKLNYFFRLKIKKPIAILFLAHLVSGMAQGISLLAVPWYFAKMGLSSKYNFYYGCLTVFILFWGLYAGTLVDKYSRIKVFVYANLVQFLVLASVTFLGYSTHALADGWVFLVLAISFLGFNIHYPNMYAFIQEMSAEDEYPKVSAVVEIIGQTTSVVSGGLAALLLEGGVWELGFLGSFEIKRWELWEIFGFDALTYVVSILLISSIKYVPLTVRKIESGAIWRRLKSGFYFLFHHKRIFAIGLFTYCVFACVMVQIYTLLPVYVSHYLKQSGSVFAAADMLFAVGALLAGVLVSRFLKPENLLYYLPIFMALNAVAYFGAYITNQIMPFFVVCFFFGFSNSATRIARISYLLANVPNYLLGRVNSIFLVCNIIERSLLIFVFTTPFFQFAQVNLAYLVISGFVVLNLGGLLIVLKRNVG